MTGSPDNKKNILDDCREFHRRFRDAILRRAQKSRYVSTKNTWMNLLVPCLLVIFAYLVYPYPTNPASSALFLSYRTRPSDSHENSYLYKKGLKDLIFLTFYAMFFGFIREFLVHLVLRPISRLCGIRTRGRQSRFIEQSYSALYFSMSAAAGFYVMYRSPIWFFETPHMYLDFPHLEVDGYLKAYYLVQASFWVHQMVLLILMVEKPRKDFMELVGHHIVTLLLIGFSYRYHFTYMGLAVYITHDVSDYFLATSKLLNYLDSSITIPYFLVFMLSWIYLRHVVNLRIIFSMIPYFSIGRNPHPMASPTEPYFSATLPGMREPIYLWPSQYSTIGPYGLKWNACQYKGGISQAITLTLLSCLQAVNIFWLFLIFRISWRLIQKGEKVDERSEFEDDDEASESGISLLRTVDGKVECVENCTGRGRTVVLDQEKEGSLRERS